jgi:hypothetical protein
MSDDRQQDRGSPRQRQYIDGTIMELHDALDQVIQELSERGTVSNQTQLRLQNDLGTTISILRTYRTEDHIDWTGATPWAEPDQMIHELTEPATVDATPSGKRGAETEQQVTGKQFPVSTLMEASYDMLDISKQLGFAPEPRPNREQVNPEAV